MKPITHEADIIIIGAGLAGLVAAAEAVDANRRVIIVEQEPPSSLGGQAFWSLGGLFLVNSPEQRRLGIRDSRELALQDWLGTAGFDRTEDKWPRKWAEAYVNFATDEKRDWLLAQGMRFFPVVGWAERGGYLADGVGNSVPRFHIVRGSGPGVIEPFVARVKRAEEQGRVQFCFRHKVTELLTTNKVITGVRGLRLEPSETARGVPSSRTVVGDFELKAQAVIITSGGIGGNHELVRKFWPARLGNPPKRLLSGVPDYVDGSMLGIAEKAGAHLINSDRMWHYPEGLHNYAPIWSHHAIRILSGPSPLWLDARGVRLPSPLFPGFDTLGALGHICRSGYDHSWFLLNQQMLKREFALSGSEQNPDLTSKKSLGPLGRIFFGSRPVDQFVKDGIDFVVRSNLKDLLNGMNALTGDALIDYNVLERQVADRDRQVTSGFGKDAQIMFIRAARRYIGDRFLRRVAALDKLTNPRKGPLIAVRLTILTRKTLGGLETDLSSHVLQANGGPLKGLFAAGEVAGFGGGGVHGYRALEGTFLGGCLFSGRTAGRSAAAEII